MPRFLCTGCLFTALAAISSMAAADSLRCGNRFVSTGDYSAEILLACGEPLYREHVGYAHRGEDHVLIEHWTYSRGPGQFLRILVIRGGRLQRIEDGDRE